MTKYALYFPNEKGLLNEDKLTFSPNFHAHIFLMDDPQSISEFARYNFPKDEVNIIPVVMMPIPINLNQKDAA